MTTKNDMPGEIWVNQNSWFYNESTNRIKYPRIKYTRADLVATPVTQASEISEEMIRKSLVGNCLDINTAIKNMVKNGLRIIPANGDKE